MSFPVALHLGGDWGLNSSSLSSTEKFYQRGTPPAPDSVIVYVHTHGGGTYVFEGHSTTLDVVLQVLSATVS